MRVQPFDLVDGHLEADEVVLREPVEDAGRGRSPCDPELGEQLAVEVGVAEAEDGALQADGVERRAQDLDHLGGALRGRRADQLHPGLQ